MSQVPLGSRTKGDSPSQTQQLVAAEQAHAEAQIDDFPEAHRLVTVSSDDATSLLDPPPAYGIFQQSLVGDVGSDGRIDFDLFSSAHRFSKLFESELHSRDERAVQDPSISPAAGLITDKSTPKLNIVIQVVGSRGDVQPFLSLGQELKAFGHRVRLATHPTFQRLVEDVGLEFFSIGGDPTELMAYMVKNPGLMPTFRTLRQGEIHRRRKAMGHIVLGSWRSCYETGNGLGDAIFVPATTQHDGGLRDLCHESSRPFVADAIIANPPTFAHIHCAEKLGIPLHLMFTMPWTPTQAFAHPLANVRSSDTDTKIANYLSYTFVELMTWQGLGDIVNRFRYKILGLERIHTTWAPGMLSRLQIPYTYCWSPELLPKPKDWASNITVAGFFSSPLASAYNAPPELTSFLNNGYPPVYIGFGSIVVGNPDVLTAIVLEAVRLAGVRAIISRGWSNLGGSEIAVLAPSNVFMLGDCPHDWLFTRVSCVIHHGGAGTTSAGINAGKPTIILPFFGDQLFWGNVIYRAGAGPQPIPFKELTAAVLADTITAAMQPDIRRNASRLGDRMRQEQGPKKGMQSFHDQLPLVAIRCALAPARAAVWQHRKIGTRLSAMAASALTKDRLVDFDDLKLYRPCYYDLNPGPWEPVSGATLAVLNYFYDTFKGFGEIGSEFVHLPYVGQKRKENSSTFNNSATREKAAPVENLSPSSSSSRPSSESHNETILGLRAAKGVGRMFKAAFRAPGTFTVALAQGAHNAPRIWGDQTVRPQDKITGVVSGVTAGCKELALGTYDGFAGIFTQPIIGAMEEGPVGFLKGLGKGFMGTPFKVLAGASAIIGYPLKGLDAEITNAFRVDSAKSIRASRIAQGEEDYLEANEDERKHVLDAWNKFLEQEQLQKSRSTRKGKEKAESS